MLQKVRTDCHRQRHEGRETPPSWFDPCVSSCDCNGIRERRRTRWVSCFRVCAHSLLSPLVNEWECMIMHVCVRVPRKSQLLFITPQNRWTSFYLALGENVVQIHDLWEKQKKLFTIVMVFFFLF
jgi:hypothetical protein